MSLRKIPNNTVHAWQNRLPGIVHLLNTYDVHIVGTQELRKWQYDQLLTSLGPNWSGIGETRNTPQDENNAIIYRSDLFDYIEGNTLWLSDTPHVVGSKSWGNNLPRIVTYGLFRHKQTGYEFYFFNTHLDHQSDLAKEKGLEMIVNLMLTLTDYPIIFTGDFNMVPDVSGMNVIHQQSDYFMDTFTPFSDNFAIHGKTSHGFNGGSQGKPIDYIYYSVEHFQVLSTEIITETWGDTYYSDHYPVYSKIIIKD